MENLITVIDDSWILWTGFSVVFFVLWFRFFYAIVKEVIETYKKEKVIYFKGFKFEGKTAGLLFFVVLGLWLFIIIAMVTGLLGIIGHVIVGSV
ncbi:MAG: hypothetical protein JW863_05385 [Chitinispirillaceae bacterium]|nr:hypothetical protein [Chitinispirillaceae bacterium]